MAQTSAYQPEKSPATAVIATNYPSGTTAATTATVAALAAAIITMECNYCFIYFTMAATNPVITNSTITSSAFITVCGTTTSSSSRPNMCRSRNSSGSTAVELVVVVVRQLPILL